MVGILLAQRRRWWPNIILQLGQWIWVVAFLTTGMKLSPLWQLPQSNLCIENAGLLLGHCQTRLINIEATLVSRLVIAVDAGVKESFIRSVLEWWWASVVHNWQVLNQQWGATLAHHWTEIGWVVLNCVYRRDTHSTIHWQRDWRYHGYVSVEGSIWYDIVVLLFLKIPLIYSIVLLYYFAIGRGPLGSG